VHMLIMNHNSGIDWKILSEYVHHKKLNTMLLHAPKEEFLLEGVFKTL